MAESHRDEIAKLEALHASNPDGRVFTHLAEAYRKGGELERAREVLDQGMAKHPDYSSAHVVMGRVLSDQGDTEAAVRAFSRVLELDRHNLVALRSLGELLGDAGRPGEALVHYRELATLDPSDLELRATVEALEESLAQQPEAETPSEPRADGTDEAPVPDTGPEVEQEPVDGEVATAVATDADAAHDADEGIESSDDSMPTSGVAMDDATSSPDADQDVEPVEATLDESPEPTPAAGPPLDWEELAGEEPALPGDLAAMREDGDTGDVTDDLEFFDFRATSLTEHGWASTGEEAEAESEREETAAGDTTVPEADLVIDDLEATETTAHASDTGPTELPAEWGQMPVAAEDTAEDVDSADLDIASLEAATEEEEEAPNESGEWLSSEDWARLRTAESGLEADVEAQPEAQGAAEAEVEAEPEVEVEPVEAIADEAEPGADVDTEEAEAGAGIGWDSGPEWYEVEDDVADDTVVTETMAELYAKQGFLDRSVEIYRALVRERPDDEDLRERLRQAESVMQQSTPAHAITDDTETTGAADLDEEGGWAEDVESVWTGGSGVAGGDPTPYAWTETESGAEARGEIGAYFRDLLAWQPPAGEQPLVNLDASSIVEAGSEGDSGDSAGDAGGNWFERAAEATGEETAEEDEDLNTFRAWLQSLKK